MIRTPVTPRERALLARAPVPCNSEAYEPFAARYLDERGYLKYVPRWGTIHDGPDDAMETFGNRTLLDALDDSDSVPALHKRAYEGRLHRYGELRTRARSSPPTALAPTSSSSSPSGCTPAGACAPSCSRDFRIPTDSPYRARMPRFAGLYMNEDPEARNYGLLQGIHRNLCNGSKAPCCERRRSTTGWAIPCRAACTSPRSRRPQ